MECSRKDNDTLAAGIANACNDNLIILGRYDGFMGRNGLVECIHRIDRGHYRMCQGKSVDGNGGFQSKLDAGRMMLDAGRSLIIGNVECNLNDLINGMARRTIFTYGGDRMCKYWF